MASILITILSPVRPGDRRLDRDDAPPGQMGINGGDTNCAR